ncbi:MAG: NYN domain-containing protein [Candidatus Pacearchaeota archaeon]
MFPSDPKGSLDDFFLDKTLVFIDEGFLYKLSMHFGSGQKIKISYIKLAKNLSKKLSLFCKHIFIYVAPPFQGTPPTLEERKRKKGYENFVKSLSEHKIITIKEGRVQKLEINGKPIYKQKGVDTLMTIDLSHIKEDYPKIKKIILISSDTDFCPVIQDIKKRGIEVYLFTYFDRIRKSRFSLSNELLTCCSRCFRLTKEDFIEAELK